MRRCLTKLLTLTMLYLGLWFVSFQQETSFLQKRSRQLHYGNAICSGMNSKLFQTVKKPNSVVISDLRCYFLVTQTERLGCLPPLCWLHSHLRLRFFICANKRKVPTIKPTGESLLNAFLAGESEETSESRVLAL